MKASEIQEQAPEIIPSNLPVINELLGGGFVSRRITEIAGPYSVGKSTIALQFVGSAQKQKKPCYWADAERSFGVSYATALGVDCEALEYDRQLTAEDLLQNLEEWASKHKNGVIVIDAIGALAPREEIEKGAGGRVIGVQARLIGSFCRRITPVLDEKNHALILLNHTFIDPTSTRLMSSGGKKLEYARSVALWLKSAYGKPDKRSSDGQKTVKYIEAEVKKDKVHGNEGRKAVLELEVSKGFASEPLPPPKRGRPAKEA